MSSTREMCLLASMTVAPALLQGCRGGSYDPTDTAASPQAQAEPTPLAASPVPNAAATVGSGAGAGPAPEYLRFDSQLPTDILRDPPHEPGAKDPGREARGVNGFTMQAVLRTGEALPPARTGELNFAAIDAAKRKTEPRLSIVVSASRARFVLSGGFILPPASELRSRVDRYGHLLFWPDESTVRIVQAGSLRALLGERRLDVAPLSSADVRPSGEGTRRLNLRTRRVEVATRAAKATLEVATLRDLGEGGVLVCRFLLDLMSTAPSTRACVVDELPLRAELRWTTGGTLTFEAQALSQAEDFSAQDLEVPPPSASWVTSPVPNEAADTLIPKAEIAAFHSAPVDLPPRPQRDGQAPLPESGLLLINSSDELRVAWLEGAPVAWVAPGGRLALTTMLRGRYSLQWRTFLGDAWDPPDLVAVPGTSELK